MSKPRKTINLKEFINLGNHFLKHSPDDRRGERKGVATMIETALFLADDYKGFSYLDENSMKDSLNGKSIGIIFSEDDKHIYPDDTRRYYYISD